jgi:hypothetical protein
MANHCQCSGEHPARRGLIGHEMILLIESAPADRRRADEWPIGAETSTAQFATLRKIELRAQCDLIIGCCEERIAKAERYRTCNDSKTKIKKIRHCRHRTTDESTRSFDDLRSRLSGRPSGVRSDCSSRRFGF